MIFLLTVLAVFMLVINIGIYGRLKRGLPLTKIQSNVANYYLNVTRKINKTVYLIVGLLVWFFIIMYAIDAGAYISVLVFIAYVVFSTRTHLALDKIKPSTNAPGGGDPFDVHPTTEA